MSGRRVSRGARDGAALDLTVRIGSATLKNPVLTASGTFGYGDEYAHVVDPALLGAVITKTVTLEARAGNPPRRIAETASGMLNSIGLENVGLARFRREKLPKLRALSATVIASVGGETPGELERLLAALTEEPGVAGFEINFSCPNVAKGGARYWALPRRLESTLRRLRRITRAPLIAKLSPDVTSVADLARACEQGGADALTAVNTFVGMAVDLDAMASKLGRATGGLSGPAIKPLALARCHEAAAAVRIPVIGSGGIVSGRDALEFIAVGAAAVQVGTATFVRPRAALEVLEEMSALLEARGIRRLSEWRGCLAGAWAKDGGESRATAPARSAYGSARSSRARSGNRPERAARAPLHGTPRRPSPTRKRSRPERRTAVAGRA
jgi:dihydroorotate dehydrogenase (NAD+) catalytic subunit